MSQAQGYPPPATTPPGEQNNSGYPGPEFAATTPAPTFPPVTFTANYTSFLPVAYQGVPAKKGMVWNYYPLTNVNPWNIIGIGWFHRYAPHNEGLPNVYGQIEFVPFWSCNQHTPQYMAEKLGADYDGYLLWINEPDTNEAAGCINLNNVQVAAQFYLDARAALPYAKFVGPHTYHANLQAHQRAMNWVSAWRDRVRELSGQYPDVTGYGIHPYDTGRDANLAYVDDYYAHMVDWGEGDKELWVTEFAYCNVQTLAVDIQYTVNEFEARTYVNRYAYWVDRRPVPPPTPFPNDQANGTAPEIVPMAWCVDPYRTITLFDPATSWTTLTVAGEAYRQVGNR